MRNAAKGYIIQVLDHNGVFLEEDENVNHLYQVIFNTLSEGAEEDASEETTMCEKNFYGTSQVVVQWSWIMM